MLPGLKRPATVALLGLLLGLGLGAWGMRFYFDQTLRRWDPEQRFVAQLDAELHLTQLQKERVSIILADQKARMEARRRSWERDVTVLGRDGEDSIASLLDPRQGDRFAVLHDAIHGRMQRYLWASQNVSTAVAAERR